MLKFVLCLPFLAACYGKGDAAADSVRNGAVGPVRCVRTCGGEKGGEPCYTCRDSTGQIFQCTEGDGCILTGEVLVRPERP